MELFITDIAKLSEKTPHNVRVDYEASYLSIQDNILDDLQLIFTNAPANATAIMQCLAIISVYSKLMAQPIDTAQLRRYLQQGLGIEVGPHGSNMSLLPVVNIVMNACTQGAFDDFYLRTIKVSPYSKQGLNAIWATISALQLTVINKPDIAQGIELSHIRLGLDNYEKKISPKQSQSRFPFFTRVSTLSTPSHRAIYRHLYYANIFAMADENSPSKDERITHQQKITLYALLTSPRGNRLKNYVFNALGYRRESHRKIFVSELFTEVEQDMNSIDKHIRQAEVGVPDIGSIDSDPQNFGMGVSITEP